MRKKLMIAIAVSLSLVSLSSMAQAQQFRTEYTVSAAGFPVGKSAFETTFSGGAYTINGTLNAAGLARLLTSVTGNLSAQGEIADGGIRAKAFDVRYTEGKTSKRTQISFSGNKVSNWSNNPKVRERGQWVPLNRGDLINAVDPIGAIMVPASSLRDVCARTLRIFDGAMRVDVPLRYLRTIPFSTTGFKGDVVTCSARYVPVSGYDANKRDVVWMRDNGNIEISFAPVASTGYYAPVAAKIKTRAVTLNVRARRFEQVN